MLSIAEETPHGPVMINDQTLTVIEITWSDGDKSFDVYLGDNVTGVCLTNDYSWDVMPTEDEMRTLLEHATCERCGDVVDDIDQDCRLCPKCSHYNDTRVIL